jgi:hypothetical protein
LVHERFVDHEPLATSYDATVPPVAAKDSPQTVAEHGDDERKRAVGIPAAMSGSVDWMPHGGRNSHQSGADTASQSSGMEPETAVDSKTPNMSPIRSEIVEKAAESGTADSRPQMTFKQPATQAAHDGDADAGATRDRVDPNRQRRKRSTTVGGRSTTTGEQSTTASKRSTAAGRSVAGPAESESPSGRRGHATTDSDPFESVDRPPTQPEPNTDQNPSRRHHRRQDTDRQSGGRGLDGSLGAESLAYDADVDRVVETLYRRLERKLRIERERTGF